jgi:hypothetical protein
MVLTEDSGASAHDTVHALVKEMLKLLVPEVQTHRVDFKPLEDESARRAMQANKWKSRNRLDERDIRQLIRSIINELLKDESFVLYHIDGDCRWSERESSENIREFKDRMLPHIEAGVRTRLPKLDDVRALEEHMRRFRLLVPFFSIEAWLYQNTAEATRLCAAEGCGECQLKLAAWKQDRASLDEVPHPKRELCFQARHNAHLATTSFPAREVFEAQTSFAHAVEHLLECDALTSALQRTYAPSEPPAP